MKKCFLYMLLMIPQLSQAISIDEFMMKLGNEDVFSFQLNAHTVDRYPSWVEMQVQYSNGPRIAKETVTGFRIDDADFNRSPRSLYYNVNITRDVSAKRIKEIINRLRDRNLNSSEARSFKFTIQFRNSHSPGDQPFPDYTITFQEMSEKLEQLNGNPKMFQRVHCDAAKGDRLSYLSTFTGMFVPASIRTLRDGLQ